jgi:RHS repeat-associated protein
LLWRPSEGILPIMRASPEILIETKPASGGTLDNPFMFTGQYYDSEIDQYYLRARQYDPLLARFTARDPVLGKFREPLTLHTYLYCLNDPVNRRDLSGESSYVSFVSAVTGTLFLIMSGMSAIAPYGPHLKTAVATGAVAAAAWGVFILDMATEDLPRRIVDWWKSWWKKYTEKELDYDRVLEELIPKDPADPKEPP